MPCGRAERNSEMTRCNWGSGNELLMQYHDTQWGVPVHEDRKHFEFLLLESMQAGLSWLTILKKRENYRAAFDGFDPVKVAAYTKEKMEDLMKNPGIIRNRRKIEAAVNNASRFLEVAAEFGSFDAYIWHFVGGKPIINHYRSEGEIPATSALSDTVARDLKRRGFQFLGSVTVYAHLQAIGVVDDHIDGCFRKSGGEAV